MNAVYLFMHQNKPNVKELTRQAAVAFHSAGISVSCEPWLAAWMGKEADDLFQREDSPFDAVVSIGGDGTFLRANQFAVLRGVPMFGVNVGRIGFLAEIELDQLAEACKELKAGAYSMESRMMLEAVCETGETFCALNDIVVSRGGYARLIAINAWVDQELVGRYIGDGLIVSTPTGSTGYSLSAGGPIVFPGVNCIILSPVCAHSLQHRPVVISSQQTVTLELDCDPTQQAQLSTDGQDALYLSGKQRVVITCAGQQAHFIRFHGQAFFSVIRQKLSEWSC